MSYGLLLAAALASGAPALAAAEPWSFEIRFNPPQHLQSMGHHGTVTIEGHLRPDGHTQNGHVVSSSRSVELDQHALSVFAKAKFKLETEEGDSRKPPKEGAIRVELIFIRVSYEGVSCRDYLAELDWDKIAWPEKSAKQNNAFLFTAGVGSLRRSIERPASTGAELVAKHKRAMSAHDSAVADCGTEPDKLFMDSYRARLASD